MLQPYVLTLAGPDRPGLVELVARCVVEHGGNWVDAKLSPLAGCFAGVVRVDVPEDRLKGLRAALSGLASEGLTISLIQAQAQATTTAVTEKLELMGPDRVGIVNELSHILAEHGVNVAELTSQVISAPMSGEPLFQCTVSVDREGGVDGPIFEALEASADKLGLDLKRLTPDQISAS